MMLTGNIQAQTANDASVRKAKVMKSIYDLQGHKMGSNSYALRKGLYIVRGRKVVK